MKKIILIAALVLITILFFVYYLIPSRHEAVFYPMGGIPFRIVAYDRQNFKFKKDFKEVQERVEKLEKIFSASDKNSELGMLNLADKKAPIQVSEDMQRVLAASLEWSKKTAGAFDITVGPLIRLYKETHQKSHLIDDVLRIKKLVGSNKFSMSDNLVIFQNPKMELDLGGIAKGYIVDEIARFLQKRGVKRGIVDAGGDIIAFGDGMFLFGIQDPFAKAQEGIIGTIRIPEGAIVTSGNYARFIEINKKKYSHIVDPRSGYPVDNGLVSATIIGRNCMDADALATAAMVMGAEKTIDWLKKNPQFHAILIEKKGDKYIVLISKEIRNEVGLEEQWNEKAKVF